LAGVDFYSGVIANALEIDVMTANTLTRRPQAKTQAQVQTQQRTTRPGRWQRGVSLVETMTALAIVGVTLGAGLPSLGGLAERQHLRGLAAQLETDLQHARSTAVAQGRTVRLEVRDDGQGGCYTLHTGSANQCSCVSQPGQAVCIGGAEAHRVVSLAGSRGVTLRSNVAAMSFSATMGTVSPAGTLRVTTTGGDTVHLVVNVMGRVRQCSPSGLAGFPNC